MPLPRPRAEYQHQPRVRLRPHLVPLVRVEVRQEPGAAGDVLAAALDLDLAVRDQQVGALVDLVLLELLARGECGCTSSERMSQVSKAPPESGISRRLADYPCGPRAEFSGGG